MNLTVSSLNASPMGMRHNNAEKFGKKPQLSPEDITAIGKSITEQQAQAAAEAAKGTWSHQAYEFVAAPFKAVLNGVANFFGNTEGPGVANNLAEGSLLAVGGLGTVGVAYGAAMLGRAAYDKVTGYFSSNKAAS